LEISGNGPVTPQIVEAPSKHDFSNTNC